MALEAGNAVKGTGLAGAIAAARRKAYPGLYNPKKDPVVDLEAEAIISYLKENMEVHIPAITATGAVGDDGVTVSLSTGKGTLDSSDVAVDVPERKGTIT